MDTVTIRNEIQNAQAHEARTQELASLLHRRLLHLQTRIVSGEPARPEEHLVHFVCKFINRTPNLLDTLLEATRNSPREDLCDALALTCVDFFIMPPRLLAGRYGLNGAMVKSYLCHRVIEELNDCCTVSTSAPLLPVDLTCSNLIIHQLIGEPFANLLDELVYDRVIRLQELAAASLALPSKSDDARRLTSLCRQRHLLDESISPMFCIKSHFSSCTIH